MTAPPQNSVSVVIPCKDDSRRLAVCLAALQRQSRPAAEVIVVDNNSSDDSASTAQAAGARVVHCAEPGIPAASSTGYDAASGELILRLDADCIPPSSWIEDITADFELRPHISALTGSARFYDGPAALRAPLAILYLSAYTLISVVAMGHRPLFGSNLAMRRHAWHAVRDDVHRDDPRLHDDMDLSYHLGERHLIGHFRARQKMSISMRPFGHPRAFQQRIARGVRTVVVHWPQDFPPYRWRRLLRRRNLSPTSPGSCALSENSVRYALFATSPPMMVSRHV